MSLRGLPVTPHYFDIEGHVTVICNHSDMNLRNNCLTSILRARFCHLWPLIVMMFLKKLVSECIGSTVPPVKFNGHTGREAPSSHFRLKFITLLLIGIMLTLEFPKSTARQLPTGIRAATPSLTPLLPSQTAPSVEDPFCPETRVRTKNFGVFHLPETVASLDGTPVWSPCPLGPKTTGAVLIYSRIGARETTTPKHKMAVREPGLTSYCVLDVKEESNLTVGIWKHHLEDDIMKECREQAWEDTAEDARALATQADIITPLNLRQLIPKLERLRGYAVKDFMSAHALIDCVSRLLETNSIFDDPAMASTKVTLFNLLEAYSQDAKVDPGEKVMVSSSKIAVETVVFPSQEAEAAETPYTFQSMTISSEALKMARNSAQDPRLQIFAYSNDLFFHWGKERDWVKNATDIPSEDGVDFGGDWRVLSMNFDGVTIENLTEPIVYTVPVSDAGNNSQWVCVFWETRENKWSSRGMKSIRLTNGTLKCESNHLTAFSVLLDPLPTPERQGGDDEDGNGDMYDSENGKNPGGGGGYSSTQLSQTIHTYILSILSSIGSALSITGLAITVLTFALFRCLRRERSNRILLNMSISLFFLHLMSLISGAELWDHHCFIPAIVLHYLLLSSISWMLVEALHMYSLLICVFVKPQSNFLTKRAVFAWGLPLVVVTISSCLDPKVYYSGRGEWCIMAAHLNLPMYYVSYLGPAALMLLINCFIFIRILKVLCQQSANVRKQSNVISYEKSKKSAEGKSKRKTQKNVGGSGGGLGSATGRFDWTSIKSTGFLNNISPTQVKGAMTVMVLLGVGWTLGFLAIGPFELVFRYLFCLCNAGQGVLIFLFRVLLHPQACRTWRKAVISGFSFDSDLTSFVSSSRKSQSGSSSSSTPTFVSPSSSAANTLTRSNPKLAKALANFLQISKIAPSEDLTSSTAPVVNDAHGNGFCAEAKLPL